jgi:phytoene dehydrogenase-like protein
MEKSFMETYDATIIGGGLAGLTAATFLAREGRRVLLLEKSNRLGGRAVTDDLGDCLFNLGPHAINKKGPGMAVLRELGFEAVGREPNLQAMLDDRGNVLTMPASPLGMLTSRLLNWREKKEFVRHMVRLQKMEAKSLHGTTLRAWVDAHLREAKVRELFYTLTRVATYSHDPDLTDAGAVFRQMQRSFKGGVTYLHGGWQTITDHLIREAEKHGVTMQLGATVTAISGTRPHMEVALQSGEVIGTENVISTLPPKATARLIAAAAVHNTATHLTATTGTSVAHAYAPSSHTRLHTWADTTLPVRGVALDLLLKKLPNPQTTFALGLENPYYFSNHSEVARLTRDPAYQVVHVFKYLSSQDQTTPQQDRAELESFLDRIQPGWRHEVIRQRFLPRLTVANGLPLASAAGTITAPQTDVPELPGLYVAGDWVTTEGLLADAALTSAKRAAALIMEAQSLIHGV